MKKMKEVEVMIKNFKNEITSGKFDQAETTIQFLELAKLSEEQKTKVNQLVFIMKKAEKNSQEQVYCPV